jgi:hypothetical protein
MSTPLTHAPKSRTTHKSNKENIIIENIYI